MKSSYFPTPEHGQAAQHMLEFFQNKEGVEALTLTCSCARGVAVPQSDLDFSVIMRPETLATSRESLEETWSNFAASSNLEKPLEQHGSYVHVEVDFSDLQFAPRERGWTSGPSSFELELGNDLIYAVPLWEGSDYFQSERAKWLPYYGGKLRQERLCETLKFCHNNLEHIPELTDRNLLFQAFHRLYDAYREFLQALFISKRVYPVAYDKWIEQQLTDLLNLPELYEELVHLFEIETFEGCTLRQKGSRLTELVHYYIEE